MELLQLPVLTNKMGSSQLVRGNGAELLPRSRPNAKHGDTKAGSQACNLLHLYTCIYMYVYTNVYIYIHMYMYIRMYV